MHTARRRRRRRRLNPCFPHLYERRALEAKDPFLRRPLAKPVGKLGSIAIGPFSPGKPSSAVMTKPQLARELQRIARMQVGDITRAVKDGQKAIALNEVTDLARSLNRLANILGAGREPASAATISDQGVVAQP